MSKKNGRGHIEIESVEASSEEKLSSGVTVTILPFPARLYDSIQTRAMEKYPEPIPPKKIIKVAGGTEEVDDKTNPQYLEEKDRSKALRDNWIAQRIGETVLDMCIVVDISPYKDIIKKIEKILDESAPSDSDELEEYFLTNYALRGRADYERVSSVAVSLMAIGDSEIVARMNNFRNQMARTENNGVETPGVDETIRVDLE